MNLLPPEPYLKNYFTNVALSAYPELAKHEFAIEVKPSTQPQFGHYQCNSAMRFAKLLAMSPKNIAEEMVKQAKQKPNSLIKELSVAGPGFINITLSEEEVAKLVQTTLTKKNLGLPPPKVQKKIVIDFSSPNTAKEMHVGHLRSTIIGDAIARLFEFLGNDVLRLNHVGDWGTSFGMLISYLKEEKPRVLTGEEKTDLDHLVSWYKESKKRFDSDPNFKRASQLEVVELQKGDLKARKAWEIICEISRKAYQKIYDLLDIHLQERGESFYNPLLANVIEELEQKNLLTESDGAKCLFLEGYLNREGNQLPLMVQKSDGGYNYATTDLAAIKHRIEDEQADQIIYVTDAGQAQHFSMLFDAAEKAHWLDRSKVKVDHVPFGLVLGPDGKKFRTRSGDTEKLQDLIEEAIHRAKKIIKEKNPDYTESDVEMIANVLGIGAIKYADLSTNRTGNYMFSYDKMLQFEGNTAAYLLYSYVRVNGIKRKVGISIDELLIETTLTLTEPAEVALGVHLLQFGEALHKMETELLPNRLTDYLYGLAEKFHTFFHECRVQGAPKQNERLLLCEAVAQTMKQGLSILGVKTVEKM